MTFINYANREVNCKIVAAGPTGCGKAEIVRFLYECVPASRRGKLVTLATEVEPTLFFDFLPAEGVIRGFKLRLHVFTVPEEVFYDVSAKKIWKGVDGILFVSGAAVWDQVADAVERLKSRLAAHNYRLNLIPLVALVFNQQAVEGLDSMRLKDLLGLDSTSVFEASRNNPQGVFDSMNKLVELVLLDLTRPSDGSTTASEIKREIFPAPPLGSKPQSIPYPSVPESPRISFGGPPQTASIREVPKSDGRKSVSTQRADHDRLFPMPSGAVIRPYPQRDAASGEFEVNRRRWFSARYALSGFVFIGLAGLIVGGLSLNAEETKPVLHVAFLFLVAVVVLSGPLWFLGAVGALWIHNRNHRHQEELDAFRLLVK